MDQLIGFIYSVTFQDFQPRYNARIHPSVGASAIRVDAVSKADVGAVVLDDDRARGVCVINGLRRNLLLFIQQIPIRLERDRLEAVGRIVNRAATFDGGLDGVH
jgi:hypothetical protein